MEVAQQRLAKVRQLEQNAQDQQEACYYTSWQWDLEGRYEFWNTHFKELGKAYRVIKGNEIRVFRREAQNQNPIGFWWIYLSYGLLWLGHTFLAVIYQSNFFMLASLYFALMMGL